MGLFNPLLVSAISCYDIAHAYIGLPQNLYHGKPEHVTKKLMGEERGVGAAWFIKAQAFYSLKKVRIMS